MSNKEDVLVNQRLHSILIMNLSTGKRDFLKEGDYILIDPFYIAGLPEFGSIDEANHLLQKLGINLDDHSFIIYEAFVSDEDEDWLTILTNLGPKDIPARYCLCFD